MVIRFFSNYAPSQELLKRFLDNYIISDYKLKFTIDEDYDVAVVFNRTKQPINQAAKIITVIQEPSWSPAHFGDSFFLENSDFVVVHDPVLFELTYGIKLGRTVIQSPSYMFYHDHIDNSFFNSIEPKHKVKKVSMIVSSLNFPFANYEKRTNLVQQILNSDLDIDIFGRGLSTHDRRYKGELQYKYSGLIPYEYSIAIENSNENNYITEKFIDCAICNTIPIYNGAPNIAQVYRKEFFRQISLDSSHLIEEIKDIIIQPAPFSFVNKEIYFKDYNLYALIRELVLVP